MSTLPENSRPAEAGRRSFGPDLIRATAIVLVLLSHTFPGGAMFPALGAVRECWGYWGVEIFFVLSGYLIGGILIADLGQAPLTSLGGVVSFWKRRWFRTLPNYFLFLILFMCQARVADGQWPPGWEKYLWFGQALYSKHPVFFSLVWSLAIEEWFYLLFPVLLLVLSNLIAQRHRAILATIAVFLVVPLVLRYFLHTGEWDAGVRKVTLPRLDSVTYGVGLAFLKKYHPPIWSLIIKAWPIGALGTLFLFSQASWQTYFLGNFPDDSIFFRVFYFCLISASIALLFPKIASLTAAASWWATVIRQLSLWSYSIYLSHIFCLGLIMGAFKLLHWEMRPGGGLLLLRDGLDWLVTMPFSAMIYHFYEKPIMDLRDQTWKTIFQRHR